MKQNNQDLAGVALVTGASSGIGRALADELARQNYRVYAAARSLPDYFADPVAQTKSGSGSIRPIRLDVTDEAAVREAFNKIIAAEGRLDCLILAAGYGLAGSIEETAIDEARAQLETNFFGAIHFLPPALAQMRTQKGGLIVGLSSVAGFLPVPFQAYYSAGKAALTALMLALAEEVRPWGIHCLIVQPGDTKTGFTKSRITARAAVNSSYEDRYSRSINRMIKDETCGASSEAVAHLIIRRMCRRRPPLVYTPGFFYRLLTFLVRILPTRLYRWLFGIYYTRFSQTDVIK